MTVKLAFFAKRSNIVALEHFVHKFNNFFVIFNIFKNIQFFHVQFIRNMYIMMSFKDIPNIVYMQLF